jgi:hypothetical protein
MSTASAAASMHTKHAGGSASDCASVRRSAALADADRGKAEGKAGKCCGAGSGAAWCVVVAMDMTDSSCTVTRICGIGTSKVSSKIESLGGKHVITSGFLGIHS